MTTVNEVSKLTDVSICILQYYDQRSGLLRPADRTEAGYRLYDDAALERLQQITLLMMKRQNLDDLPCKKAENDSLWVTTPFRRLRSA